MVLIAPKGSQIIAEAENDDADAYPAAHEQSRTVVETGHDIVHVRQLICTLFSMHQAYQTHHRAPAGLEPVSALAFGCLSPALSE